MINTPDRSKLINGWPFVHVVGLVKYILSKKKAYTLVRTGIQSVVYHPSDTQDEKEMFVLWL